MKKRKNKAKQISKPVQFRVKSRLKVGISYVSDFPPLTFEDAWEIYPNTSYPYPSQIFGNDSNLIS